MGKDGRALSTLHRLMRSLLLVCAIGGITIIASPRGAAFPRSKGRATTFPGTRCPVFPADNVWNTKITDLPVAARSAQWVAAIDAGDPSIDLHPDFGPGGGPSTPYGIPITIVTPRQRFVHVTFQYASESDPGPYPFGETTAIEGGKNAAGDRHALMLDPKTCTLYELFDSYYQSDNRSTAGSGAIWHLRSNRLRPVGWTSADAAGLPILPGLVTYAEVRSGHIDHAIRFTAPATDDRYIWPARHEASEVDNSDLPPMGARFRLRASFDLPPSLCSRMCQTVVTAMKQYGLILADNGSSWYFQGASDPRWTYAFVDQLKQIPASAFVAVDESSLMCSPDSGQARQAGLPNGGCPIG
ncbi:MAG: hypothetical protein WCF24_10490 [Acidimicrobiales bacterium]